MAKQLFSVGQVLTAAQMTSLQQTAMGGGLPSVKTASYVLVAADAGTVIQVNSTSATTVTVNTGLFSAGDSVQIQNIGSGTTTITAGTATVNSAGSLIVTQYDGGFLYFSSTGSSLWFDYTQAGTSSPLTTKGDLYTRTSSVDSRLAVGATNGQILSVDSAEATGLKWITPSSGTPSYVGCSLYMSAAQSIPNDSWTSINFDSEWFDTDGFHSTSSNTSRITIPSGKAGKYAISPQWVWASIATQFETYLSKNGNLSYLGSQTAPGSGLKPTAGGNTWILDLVVGDYIEMKGLHKYGSAVNMEGGTTNTQFSIVYLGA